MSTKDGARGVVWAALGFGMLGDLLLRPAPAGLGLALWISALAIAAIAARPRLASLGTSYSVAPLAVAAALGFLVAWRDSAIMQGLFAAGALLAWTVAFLDRPARAGVTAHAAAAATAIASAVLAPPLVLARARSGAPATAPRRLKVAVGGAFLAAPLLLVFGSLFAAADPLFERYANDLARSLDEALGHIGTSVLLAWLAGGLAAGLALARWPSDLELGRLRPEVGNVLGVALALVVALFFSFLAVQAGAILAGSAWIEARAGVSYAEYARHGFFQLLACAGIALPLVLLADWAIPPGDRRRRRMTALSLALVLAVLLVLAAAARRMALYVGAYGLTELRYYASATMVWLGVAFAAFVVASVRGRRDRFAFHALTAAAIALLGLGILNPPARIVAFNVGRSAESPAEFDAVYAVSLGADAVPVLLDALPSLPPGSRCEVAHDLLARREPGGGADWRTFNFARARAQTLLAAAESELQALAFACDLPISRSGATRRVPRLPPSRG